MNSMFTVMSFTIRSKLRSRSFLVTTLILFLLAIVAANVPTIIDKIGSGGGPTKVGYVSGEQDTVIQGLQSYFAKQEEPDVQLVAVDVAGGARDAALKQAIDDKKIKGYLTFADNAAIGFPDVTYSSKKLLDTDTAQSLKAALQSVKTDQAVQDAKLTDAQLSKLFAAVKLDAVQIGDSASGKTEAQQGTAIGLTYVILFLLFMSVMITGQMIASEITAEKSSRVMEIIVTSVSPLKQMFGKVIGVFLVGLIQLVVLVGAALININLAQNRDALKSFGIDFSGIDPTMIVYAVLFYLAGFFLYAMLFAAVGSIVSRTEELGQAIMPVTMLTLAGFYIAIFGLTHPDSPFITVCSFIPFFSPFIMFLRIGLTEPAWWEVVVSIAILVASVLAIGWLSAKIYRAGVLMYGKRPSIKELVKAMKAFKV